RQNQAYAHEKRAEELISAAIVAGRIYVAGDKLMMKVSSVKDCVERAMSVLVESVYTKLGYIRKNYDSDADLLQILNGSKQMVLAGTESPNAEASKELLQYLEIQKERQLPTSMGDLQKRYQAIPYGWREIDIAAIVAELIAAQKLVLKYGGVIISPSDKKIIDYLRKKTEIDKAIIAFKVAPPTALIKKCREFLSEYHNCTLGAIPDDETGLLRYITEKFDTECAALQGRIAKEYAFSAYPGKNVVENGIKLCEKLLAQKNDSIALLKKAVELQDDFLDFSEDISDVDTFFRVQREIFDRAKAQTEQLDTEKEYFQTESDAIAAISKIKEILAMPKPYKRISELPELVQTIQNVYEKLLVQKREEVIGEIQAAMGEIHQTADVKQGDIVQRADAAFIEKRTAAEHAKKLTSLDAMKIQIGNIRQQYLQKLLVVAEPDIDMVTINRSTICHTMQLKSEADIDRYVAEIKKSLLQKLNGHDVLHII
ncbi:MAG: hypothetical protein ACLS8H_10510, partial [Ruminococcus sp.]